MQSRVLLIDDDDRFRERLASALTERDLDVRTAAGTQDALALIAGSEFEAIVTDLRMPKVTGLQFVEELVRMAPDARIIVLTGYGTIATAVQAMRVGAADYLVKPCNADQLYAALSDAASPDEEHMTSRTPSLASLEREHIERVLVECNGNVSKAARVLGIHRRTLQYKLSKFSSSE